MATMAKHKKRSRVTYNDNKRNANHWLMTRPYIVPMGLRRVLDQVKSVRDEANNTIDEA